MNKENDIIEDLTLVRSVLSGNKSSFSLLVQKYKDMVFNLLWRLTGNPAEAEDLTQESFLRIYMNLSKFNLTLDLRNWIYAVALNVCRSRMRKKRVFFFSINKEIDDDGNELLSTIGDDNDNPEKTLVLRENQKRVRKIINSLPYKYRAVFILRYLEDRSYDEISQITDLPLGTVKTFLFRGQKILSKRLAQNPETFLRQKE